jgi:regulatory protein
MSAERAPRIGAPGGDLEQARALQEALGHAYRHLAQRDRTVAEMRTQLRRCGVERELIEPCLVELREQGYLNDARFARRFAEDRRTLDGWGAARIRARLQELGIAAPLAEAATERDSEAEGSAAVAVLRRRLRAPPASERERRRAFALLVRRGYEPELAEEAVRRFERESP